ncbi:hypothetical protein EYF80_005789 [Liparis tanakae]|uniref:Uncharacterized protein n=1 Tax=Liparis tanakae TaxID=230148 RepID=A0A4Z2J2H2_9TELE|nr:hypothetical protein EYF80_005789 [Liparis tanakae]
MPEHRLGTRHSPALPAAIPPRDGPEVKAEPTELNACAGAKAERLGCELAPPFFLFFCGGEKSSVSEKCAGQMMRAGNERRSRCPGTHNEIKQGRRSITLTEEGTRGLAQDVSREEQDARGPAFNDK